MPLFSRRRRKTFAALLSHLYHSLFPTRYPLPLPWKEYHRSRTICLTGDHAASIADPYELTHHTARLIRQLYYMGYDTIITGAHEGFDTIVFEAFTQMRKSGLFPLLRLVIVTHDEELRHFSNARRMRFKLDADSFIDLSRNFPAASYIERNECMLRYCSRLLVYCNTDHTKDPVTDHIMHLAHLRLIESGNLYTYLTAESPFRRSDQSAAERDILDFEEK